MTIAERGSVRTTTTVGGRRTFYLAMGVLAIGIPLVGFGPGVILTSLPRRAPPTAFIWLHALVFSSWLLLYVAQAVLVRAGYRHVHRRLGWVGVPLAAAVVVVGYLTTVEQGRRGFPLWWDPAVQGDNVAELVHPFGDLLTFTVLVSAAFFYRRRPDAHKRFILLATVGSMMAAPLAHLISYFPALRAFPPVILLPLAALYFSSAIYDRLVHGRVHPVSLWGGVGLLAFSLLRGGLIGSSDAWHRFVGWLVG